MKSNKSSIGKFVAMGLSGLIVLSPAASALASSAQQKEEVVYVLLNGDGSKREVYVVNSFNEPNGEIVDYGDYESVRNLTTDDKVEVSGSEVRINTDSSKLYYEGSMPDAQLPWDIEVAYKLGGETISAADLAGKDGKLEIGIYIDENTSAPDGFYDDYALQVSVTLDTKRCSDIEASGATVAMVGSNRQLTYTILPGKAKDISIKADVSDFEMDPISINGVMLTLGLEVDDMDYEEKLDELIEGVEKIDDGSHELNDGISSLQDGASALKGGTSDLQQGSNTLNKGLNDLNNGIKQMQKGLAALDSKSGSLKFGSAQVDAALKQMQQSVNAIQPAGDKVAQLAAGSANIKQGIGSIADGASQLSQSISYAGYKAAMESSGLDIDALMAGNNAAEGKLESVTAGLNAIVENMEDEDPNKAALQAQINELQGARGAAARNNAAYGGMEGYLGAVSESANSLSNGAAAMSAQYAEFDAAIQEMTASMDELFAALPGLQSGLNTLVSEYEGLDAGITEYTGAVGQLLSGFNTIVNGSNGLAEGSKTLAQGSSGLHDGADELLSGVIKLYDGSTELTDGTGELRTRTADIEEELNDTIDEQLGSLMDEDEREVKSFVSTRNTNVGAVQFVMKTDEIKIADFETVPAQQESKEETIGDRVKNLFVK